MRNLLITIMWLTCAAFGCGSGNPEWVPTTGPDPKPNPDQPTQPSIGRHYEVSSVAELKALGALEAGDTVVWRNGTYADIIAELKATGSEQYPVVLKAEEAGKVRFTGISRLQIKGSYVVTEGFHWVDPTAVKGKAVITIASGSHRCRVQNCAITGDNTEEHADIDAKWVSLYGTENTVEGCTFRDKRNMGTLLVVWLETGIVPKHQILNNRFERPVTLYDADDKAINGQETIRIGTSDFSMQNAECVVEGNVLYHCHGELAEAISNKSCGNIYRRNLFVETKGSLTMRHGNNCVATGNYFIGNKMAGTGGIRLIGEGHTVEYNYFENLGGSTYHAAICLVRGEKDAALNGYWQVKNARVANNTIVDCAECFRVNYGARSTQVLPVISTTIEKNTVSVTSSTAYAVRVDSSNPEAEIEWKDNTIYGGKQSGVTLTTTPTAPNLPNIRPAMTSIAEAAGCEWERK